jgi:hypothetical protein
MGRSNTGSQFACGSLKRGSYQMVLHRPFELTRRSQNFTASSVDNFRFGDKSNGAMKMFVLGTSVTRT